MRYIAYAVDLDGVARAAYEIDCQTDKDAQLRAEKFLEAHPAVEVWDGPRRVARLVRESGAPEHQQRWRFDPQSPENSPESASDGS